MILTQSRNGNIEFWDVDSERHVATWSSRSDVLSYYPMNESGSVRVGKYDPLKVMSVDVSKRIENLYLMDQLATLKRAVKSIGGGE